MSTGFCAGHLDKEDYQAIQDKKSRVRLQRSLDILMKMKLIKYADFPEDSTVSKLAQLDFLVINTKPYFEQPVRAADPDEDQVMLPAE